MGEPVNRFSDSAASERFMGRWSRAAGTVFVDWIDAPTNARWLDVGCGTGVCTALIVEKCAPAQMCAVDPEAAQIDHASRQPVAEHADFKVGDARALPFPNAAFDVVTSALVLNFVPDRFRAACEMRRVARPGGLVAGYVWDFEPELSPSWPLRLGMRKFGLDVPSVPGTMEANLGALRLLFESAGLEELAARSIEVTVPFRDFDDFWQAQTPSYSPTTKMIAALTDHDRTRLIEITREGLPARPDGRIAYVARANAIKARVPS